jgi:hypothetical protein
MTMKARKTILTEHYVKTAIKDFKESKIVSTTTDNRFLITIRRKTRNDILSGGVQITVKGKHWKYMERFNESARDLKPNWTFTNLENALRRCLVEVLIADKESYFKEKLYLRVESIPFKNDDDFVNAIDKAEKESGITAIYEDMGVKEITFWNNWLNAMAGAA